MKTAENEIGNLTPRIDWNIKNNKPINTQNSVSMNNSQLNASIRFHTKSTPIINKNEILNEFNNLHKLKHEISNYNANNNNNYKNNYLKNGEQYNSLNSIMGKMPSENKFVNNRGYKTLNNSEPRKIISSSFRNLKAGVTYSGSLYNNKMENFNASTVKTNYSNNASNLNNSENFQFSNKMPSKNASFTKRPNDLNNTGNKKSPNVSMNASITKNKLKNTSLISNSQIFLNLNNESFMKRSNIQTVKDSLIKGKEQTSPVIRLKKSNSILFMNSNHKISSLSREHQKGKDLLKNNSSRDFLLERKNSNLTINNLNNSNSNINSVNNSTNLVSISTSSHIKPAKNINTNKNKKNNLFYKNQEERKSKEIVLNDYNLSSTNFGNENNSKKETTNNNFVISNNNNQNITSNNFNTIISNSNSNHSLVVSKDTKVNPNYDKYYKHLLEKKEYAEKIIQNLLNEKEKLKKIIVEETEVNQAFSACEKLNNEIKNYKNITDSCLKTCSQLTAEIVQLKKEIEKFGFGNQNSAGSGNISNNNNGIGSFSQSQIRGNNSASKRSSQSNFKKK